jgi:putative flippase GtrA
MKKIAGLFLSREFLLFLMAGGTAAAAQWGSRFLFSHYVAFAWAVALAYLVGLATAFALNKLFVFGASGRSVTREMTYFALVNAISFPIVWVVSIVLGEMILPGFMPRPLAEALGNGVGIVSPVGLSFVLHKFFTFRKVAS